MNGSIRYAPFSAIYFYTYAELTSLFGSAPLLLGAAAGAVAGAATQPLDWLKTRVQAAEEVAAPLGDICVTALREEGVGAVVRGGGARALWLGELLCGFISSACVEGSAAI